MTKKFVEKCIFQTRKEIEQFEKAIEVVAGIRILNNKTKLSFEAETARIERCVEHFYKTQDFDEDFYEFGLNFIKELANELVYSGQYEDTYLSNIIVLN